MKETVLIEISIENWNKLRKIADDTRHGRAANARTTELGDIPEVTTDEVLSELLRGRY